MTHLPDDQIDPYEARLARRIGAFSEQAVRPIDATAIAAEAHAAARRRSVLARLFGSAGSTARFGLVFVGALVAAGVLGVYIGAGGKLGLGQTATATPATPTAVLPGANTCAASALTGEITAWEGAAGHRIASIDVRNAGSTACDLPQYLRPALVDTDGHVLITGQLQPEPAPIDFAPGAQATAMVDMSNYCGQAPTGTLELRMYLPDGSSILVAVSRTLDLPAAPDAPPCLGRSAPATIEMQAFELASSS